MHSLTYYLRRYPNRIKYGLLVLDIFAMIVAVRVIINYTTIQDTIQDTTLQREMKMAELAFTQNFLTHYERSDFARYFLQHENNMLAPGEYIIKFEEATKKALSGTVETTPPDTTDQDTIISSPQGAWKKFLQEKTK